jgi:dCMP deaminase
MNWDEYFLQIAAVVALKSKDLGVNGDGRVGAVVVSPDELVISTGFNGIARGLVDAQGILMNAEEKFKWICHAETNAIFNAARIGVSPKGSTLYVTKFPCFECLKAIIQAGVVRIYTHDDKFWDDDPADQSDGQTEKHGRKLELLRQDLIKVDAPFHPEFHPAAQIKVKNMAAAFSNGHNGEEKNSRR